MSVSKQDREDYERGQRDRHSSLFDQASPSFPALTAI